MSPFSKQENLVCRNLHGCRLKTFHCMRVWWIVLFWLPCLTAHVLLVM